MIRLYDASRLFRGKKAKINVESTNPYSDWSNEKELGKGTYGEVHLYRKRKKRVAIKTFKLNPKKYTREQIKEDFDKELAGFEAAGLHKRGHDNVVKFKKAFYTSFGFCIALEYCKYGDLSGIYKNHSDYTEKDIRDIIMQCCSGLQYLLRHLIVHRDIKDGNILVKQWKPKMHVCLADLNFSRKVKSVNHTTDMKTKVGSPAYEAPEIEKVWLRNSEGKYNHKIDVYSLGRLAYELCTFDEQKPTEVDLPQDVIDQIVEIRSVVRTRESPKEIAVLKSFYASFNDTGVPLEPKLMFENLSHNARVVISKMLLPIYTERLDYPDILASDWAKMSYPKNIKPIIEHLESIM